MSPRDKALAELLDAAAAYLDMPTPRWEDREIARDAQRQRMIRVQCVLEAVAADLRTHAPKPAAGPGSLASLLGRRLEGLRGYAAESLGYEPYVPQEQQ
jgi:hypothetical protein